MTDIIIDLETLGTRPVSGTYCYADVRCVAYGKVLGGSIGTCEDEK